MSGVVTVPELLDGHTVLDIECLDRLYLNGYVPSLQVSGQVASFMTAHLKQPIPSPSIMEKMRVSRARTCTFSMINGLTEQRSVLRVVAEAVVEGVVAARWL